MLGHMVTLKMAERADCAYSNDFESAVEQAKSIGLGRKHLAIPRFGSDAFRVALRTLKTNPHEVTVPLDQGIIYDNMRCKVWYDTVNMGREYCVRRHSTGLVNGEPLSKPRNFTVYRIGRKRRRDCPNTPQSIREACLEGKSGPKQSKRLLKVITVLIISRLNLMTKVTLSIFQQCRNSWRL